MSIFAEEWRACLREQYKHVIRTNDPITRASLITVLHEVGFGDDELRQLEVEATIRADDMPDDFTPDLNILSQPRESAAPSSEMFAPHPLECQCPACVEINLIPHDEDGQPIELGEENQDDAESPQQLTLF